MKKHLCGLAIILLICAALFALPAFAADVAKNESTGTLYDTLDAALEESNDGDTITLLDDVETADPEGEGSYTYWPLTIEMNGHGITGKLTVTDDLKLKGGWFYGLLVVDISGEEGALTITAPDTADYAVNQMLTVNDGTVNISGAKIAVRGTLSVSSGTAVTLSGTEKAVELFGAETFGNKFYGAVDAGGDTDTAAVYNAEQQTYTVGGVAAKKLSNINAGEPDPAEKPKPNPGKNTLDARAGAPTDFKVNFTGTENLEVSIQKSALDDTIRVSAGKTADNMWTVTVTLADEPKHSSYLLHIYPAGDTSRSATVTVNVVPHKAKVVESGKTTYLDDLSCTLTADDGSMQITLLADIEIGAYSDPLTLRGGSPITLDLGGHSIAYVCIGEDIYDENYGTIGYNSSNVTVVGDGSIKNLELAVGTIRVSGGTVNNLICFSSYEQEGMSHGDVFIEGGTLNGNLSVSKGNYNVTVSGGTGHKVQIFCDAIETEITDGEFEELILVPPTSSDCTLVLSGGKFGKIKTQSKTNEKGLYLAKYLAPDYFFYTKPAGGSDYTQLVDASAVTELTDVVIKKHTHTPGADGKCTECGFTLEAQVGDTYYAYFSSAVKAAAEAGGTVKLLCNVTATGPHNIAALPSGTYTLDLAGHKLSVGTDAENPGCFSSYENTALTITSSDGAGILNAELYIHGDFKVAANLSVEGLVEVYKSLDVDSTSYVAPTFNGEVTVKNGGTLTVRHGNFRKNVTVEDGGKLNAFERDGGDARFAYPVKINAGGKLRVTGSSSFQNLEIAAGAYVSLMGGRFNGYIYTSDNSPLAPYLADGYAFENFVTGVIQDSGANSLTTVTVVGHTAHTSVDADTGKCACGKQMLAVRIARDNRVVAGYDNLPDALNEAAFGDTVRIFGDAATGNLVLHPQGMQPQITLDLNGKQVDGGLTLENVKLTVENGTLSATSALTVAKDASLTLNDVECGWDVTVSGKLAVTDADTVCTGTVTVKDGGSAALAGGAYKKIVCETGTVADCLEDAFGYTETANAESWLGGDGKTIADTTVLRIPLLLVHIGNTSVPYGTDGMLTVLYDTIDISPDRSKVSFQWYTISGDTYTPLADETDDMYVLRAGTVPGKYHVACAVTYKGYTMRADGLIGIRKATLTEGTHYTAPTAASLVYDGNAHALLAAGSIAANADLAGCKFVYSDSKDGNYTETMPTATAAGNYTVWYMVKGNNCFEDSAKGSIDVHIAVATVTAVNKDYPSNFTYGKAISAPTKANLTVTGDYDDATLTYAWRDAAGNTLAETPAELGSYTLHIEIAATANTGAAVVDIPVSIKPDTAVKAVTQGVEVYNGNLPRSYEVDLLALAKAGGYVPDGDTLTVRDQFDIYFFTDDGNYCAYDPATADYAVTAIQKDGEPTTLVITVAELDRSVYKTFCMINARLSDAHYTNIVAQLSLIAIDKEEKTLSVMMDGWTYGLYDGAFNRPVYMVPAGTEKTTVTYYAEDGSELAGVPTDAGNYSVRVVCETGDAIWSGSADFTIARRDIADASVTLGDALTYDTTEQTQTVRAVHFDGVDVSYTVETGSDKATNAGNYTLRLIGTGNYTGTKDVPFTVSAKLVNASVVVEGNYTYAGGNAILPTVKVTDGNVEIDPSEYTVACANNIHAGTATVRIVNADGGNYVVSGTTTFEIGKAAQNLAADAVTGVYGESGKTVSATGTVGAITYAVTAGSEVLDVNESGALTFRQGGDATVRISAAGDNDHAAAFIDVNVHVDKAHVTLRALDKQIRTGNRIPALDAPVLGTDYTVEGLLGSDSLTGKVTLRYDGTPNASRAGEYAILIEHDGTDPRYTADAAAGKLTVKRSTDGKAEKSYKISVRTSEGGSVSPYGTILALAGKDQTLTFVSDDGYRVSALYIDGSRVPTAESYTFKRVNSTHTVEVIFAKIGDIVASDFDDVPDDGYYKDAVDWAVDRGITVGASAMKFDPNGICTRAQAVTFLWRALGKPAAKNTAMSFTDVAADAYYADAVLWAVENKIVLGVSETKFDPDGICTRAQIVTLLWRTAESPTADSANPFTDVAADAYYADAVLWAVGKEITIGTSGTTFSPNRICTRAEIVTFLYRTLAK